MSDIFNPIGRSLPGRAGPTLVTGVVSDPPRSLMGLITGTILKGTVVGKGADGLTTIATDKGTVSVATNALLPTGSAVTLEVRNAGGDRLQVLILAVETAAARNNAASQPAHSGSADGANSTATASSGAAGAAAHKTDAKPAPRPTGPPTIQIAGSSVKAIVVQAPAPASLLPSPDVDIEPFTAPSPPISVPDAAAQKAQILAQARALIAQQAPPPQSAETAPVVSTAPSVTASGTGGTVPVNPLPSGTPIDLDLSVQLPTGGAPPPSGTAPSPTLVVEPVTLPQIGGTALQPEVAARIAALFAAADTTAPTPVPSGGLQTPATPANAGPSGNIPVTSVPPAGVPIAAAPLGALPIGASNPPPPGTMPASTVPPGSMPAVNMPPGAMPASLVPAAASPLLAQILGTAQPASASPAPTMPMRLSTGAELTLHVVAVLPMKGGAIEFAPEATHLTGSAAPIIGRVLGYTRAGHAVIDTPQGVLMMQERTRLPVGAQVALVLEPAAAPPPVALPPITNPQQALLSLSSGWPTLDDLLTVLRAPVGAQDDATPPPPLGVPQTGPRLAAGLSTAINALRTGDIEKLLAPMLASRKLPADKEELVKRLKDEFTQLSDLAKDRPQVDWRALFLPVYDERVGLTQINLYYRHNNSGGENEKEKKDQGTRFLVDVNFAALGAFQLDGLIRGKRFDLMIRSRSRLSRKQRQDIIGIFENALEVGGATGGLEFRTVDVFPVSPLDELRQSHDHLTA